MKENLQLVFSNIQWSNQEKRNSIVALKDLALSRSHNDTPETMIFEKTSGITSWSQPDSNPLRKSCEISLATRMEYDRADLYIWSNDL